jgi:hypothetical protein
VKLKLFLEDFNPSEGIVSYAVENENGDRVGRGEYQDESIKNYSPATMDFFVLAFLPRLEELEAELRVQGPISESLNSVLDDSISSESLVTRTGRAYKDEDIKVFKDNFIKTRDLNETLAKVFKHFT